MNIFWLDSKNEDAVKMYCDSHVVKIILECGQMISTALRMNGYQNGALYKKTHSNHPMTEWVADSSQHLRVAIDHMHELDKEYRYRKNPDDPESVDSHKSWRLISCVPNYVIDRVPDRGFENPPRCMDDKYKSGNVVESYRNYYANGKMYKEWFTYSERDPPSWLHEYHHPGIAQGTPLELAPERRESFGISAGVEFDVDLVRV